MEGKYSDNETEDEDDIDDSSKSKKKAAAKSGLFNLENKSAKAEKNLDQKRVDLLSLLTKKTVEVEDSSEKEESEEVLSDEEKQQIERQIVLEHQAEYQTQAEGETDMSEIETSEAIDIFHDKIINENLDSSEALAETLDEIEDNDQADVEELISLRTDYNESPVELTEERVALRISAIEPAKQASNETADEKKGVSIMQPIFDRVRSLDVSFKRLESKKLDDGSSVSEVVERIVAKKQESSKPDRANNLVKKNIENQVAQIKTEIITKELTVKQAVIEKNKTEAEVANKEIESPEAPEANRSHSSVSPESIGKVLVKAEATKNTPRIEITTLEPIDKHVETISRSDLLELSAKTLVDGTTLRHVYETNLITEKGLRRVLTEHLRGGDIKRALKRELVEHEKDFERDPNLRDKPRQTTSRAVNNLITKVDPDIIEQPSQLQTLLRTEINISPKNLSKKKVKVSWVDIVLLVFIGLLLTMVLSLVMGR